MDLFFRSLKCKFFLLELSVQIRLYATLRQIAATRELEISIEAGATVGEVLRSLVTRFPRLEEAIWNPDGSLAGHVAVILNGRDIRHLSEVDTPVSNDDRLDVFPPVGGGAKLAEPTNVNLKFASHFHARVGMSNTKFTYNGNSLREFIPALLEQFDIADLLMEDDELRPPVLVVINGRYSYLIGGWDAQIPDGATVVLLHAYGAAF
jgi:molybdopterin synthase sulfur carrier subunit